MKPIAFITGATSGIGKAISYKIAENYNLILCGRRQEVLAELSKELSLKTDVITLQFDVGNRAEVQKCINTLPEKWQNINVLINSAGNAHGLDTIDKASVDDFDAMIDGNVKGLLYVSKAIIPFMIANKKGHIINLSSIAGKQTYTKGTVYCASKHAVESISKGMRLDLLPHNIKVTNIAPGAVNTDFSLVRFKGDQNTADDVYKGFEPLIAEDIADCVHFVLSQPDRVQIADMTILPKAQADAANVLRI